MGESIQKSTEKENYENLVFKVLKASFWIGIGASITAIIALILGSVAIHKTVNLKYYLEPNHTAVWGDTIIWKHKNSGTDIYLYFANKATYSDDVKWDGTYPANYFGD